MLGIEKRTAILEMYASGIGIRKIAKLLKSSRGAVRRVIREQSPQPPKIERPQLAETHLETILELHALCRGNLVRVHEELVEQGILIAYPTLTAFCRRHEIGAKPPTPTGRYTFRPGEEMQHDTSPHKAKIEGRMQKIQTAGAILCHSRMLFVQHYPRFTRFECKVFLTEALRYFQGAPETTMIDNTHVVVLRGTGEEMIPTPEMENFAERLGFRFRAHAPGDANRSARVERLFHHVENNFLAGREFTDPDDLNRRALQWCEKVNASYKRAIKARPIDLYAAERACLRPLPEWIPEPTRVHHRTVDVHAYVTLHKKRYSAPADWIGRRVQVRESWKHVDIDLDRRKTVRHPRIHESETKHRSTLPEHRLDRPKRRGKEPEAEEKKLREIAPELNEYVAALKKRGRKSKLIALRQLLRMVREYPREPLRKAVAQAAHYGLYDLDRVETIVLRAIATDYFLIDPDEEYGDD